MWEHRSASARASTLALCLGLCACASAPQRAQPSPSAQAPSEAEARRWDAFLDEFIEQSFVEEPSFAVSQGRHEFDGKVSDLSRTGLSARIARLSRARERATAFMSRALDEKRSFEREYLIAKLDASLFWLTRVPEQARNPLLYANEIDPSVYVTREYAPPEKRLSAYVSLLGQVPRVVGAMKENLRLPLPRTFVDVGVQVFGGLGPYLEKDVPKIFEGVKDEVLQNELKWATGPAVKAVNDAKAWLEAQKEMADDSFALGPDLFREMLWATERVDTPLDELAAVGKRDLERNLEALTRACAQIAKGKTLHECALVVGNEKPEGGPVLGARAQLGSLKSFLKQNDLVSIPSEEEARVEEAPPYKRWNQAYIDIPGPFEVGMPSIYYIAPPDPAWSEADKLAYIPGAADLLFISVHEVWPGHFLQFLHAKQAERMFGRLFVGYAFAEGWAHYTEELMWEAGLSGGDEKVHVGQLLNALLRNVRFLSALGLHTQGMTVAESEAMFREKALQDAGNAKQQAARGTFDPAYLNYTLGKLMIRKMREDFAGSRGGRAAWRTFHDRFLSYGGPPLPLVRKAMLGEASELL